jgi:hypothetical protein
LFRNQIKYIPNVLSQDANLISDSDLDSSKNVSTRMDGRFLNKSIGQKSYFTIKVGDAEGINTKSSANLIKCF